MTQPPEPDPRPTGWAVRAALAVVALFLLAALPLAIWQFTSNSDEPRYSVAAARMMATGDYIVPEAAWGEVRLLKPPLAYYYIVAGFALFGQSVIGAKALWLVSSAAILGLTWALARLIGATRGGAAVAVVALAGNILFYRSTLIHNPDIPMVLGLTLSMAGFARILRGGRAPVWSLWAAWMGIAVAFLAKGLLALALAAVALALRALASGFGRPRRAEIAAIAVALVTALWWHVVVAIREPAALWAQFVGDQVTGKAAFDPMRVLQGLSYDALFLGVGFLPILIAALPPRLRRPGRPSRPVLFLALWSALVVVIFAFSNYLSERYMLPAMPAVAALIGLGFSGLDGAAVARRAGRAVRILLPLPLAVGLLTAGIVFAETVLWGAVVLVLAVAGAVLVWRLAGSRLPTVTLALLALVAPGTVLLTYPAYRVLAFPTAADIGVALIDEAGIAPAEVAVLQRWHLLERIGLQRPPIEDYRFTNDPDPAVFDGAALILTVHPRQARALEDMGYAVREERGAPQGFGLGDLVSAIGTRDLAGLRAAFGETLFVATPAPAGSDALPLEMDQPEVPAVDEDPEGLAQDEDRVGPVDGVGEQDDPAAE